MNYHAFPEKLVKVKKPHKCWGCVSIIVKGTLCLKQSGVHKGEGFFNGYFCDHCASFIKTESSFDWMEHQDGLFMGDVKEYDDYSTHKITPLTDLKLV